MKIKDETYKYMKTAFTKAFQRAIAMYSLEQVKDCYKREPVRTIWEIWNMAYVDLKSSNDSPRYKIHKRILPYDPTFDIYADGISDKHIETALKRICKEILN